MENFLELGLLCLSVCLSLSLSFSLLPLTHSLVPGMELLLMCGGLSCNGHWSNWEGSVLLLPTRDVKPRGSTGAPRDARSAHGLAISSNH